ncbi:MAG: hypothetical protein WJ295_06805 [Ferrovum myxofaciens]|nr:hypothetical protein [Ferrovum myxofaciens]
MKKEGKRLTRRGLWGTLYFACKCSGGPRRLAFARQPFLFFIFEFAFQSMTKRRHDATGDVLARVYRPESRRVLLAFGKSLLG